MDKSRGHAKRPIWICPVCSVGVVVTIDDAFNAIEKTTLVDSGNPGPCLGFSTIPYSIGKIC